MANFVYQGPGPHVDDVIGLVRPGDVRQFDAEPDWGPWQLLTEAIAEGLPGNSQAPDLNAIRAAVQQAPAPPSPLGPPATPAAPAAKPEGS